MPALPLQSFCSGFWHFSVPIARTFLASLALSRRLGLQKSCYMVLECGHYLHQKALLYFILLIAIKRNQWLIIVSSYHEIPFKHQRPDDPVHYHEAR
jgi:hypothetical protein